MAKSSKGFKELRQLHQLEQSEQRMMAKMQQKIQQGEMGDSMKRVVKNAKGQVKMSNVLEKFIEPYLPTAKTFADQETLVNVAVIAWNLALLPEAKRQEAFDAMFQGRVSQFQDIIAQKEATAFIHELIDRKLQHFAHINRLIMEFEVQNAGDRFNLVVVSMPAPPAPEG